MVKATDLNSYEFIAICFFRERRFEPYVAVTHIVLLNSNMDVAAGVVDNKIFGFCFIGGLGVT